MEFTAIGTIRTPFAGKRDCPIQAAIAGESRGTIEVLPEYAPALEDIEMFSHIYVFYRFDRAGEVKLVRPTFLDDRAHGVFASRHPCRPNSMGMSVLRLIERKANTLTVEGVDMLDNSPLLDIKPYIPRFDCFPDASGGWMDGLKHRPKPEGRE